MRELTIEEVQAVCGGSEAAPLDASTGWGYFNQCMEYTNPSATLGAGLGALSLVRGFDWMGVGASAWGLGTAAVCGLGAIQYTQ